MADNENDAIEFGRLKIKISYITVFALLVLGCGLFMRALEWGQQIGVAGERLLSLETVTKEQITRLEGTTKNELDKFDKRIKALEEAVAEQSGDQKAIKALLQQLLKERKEKGKDGG